MYDSRLSNHAGNDPHYRADYSDGGDFLLTSLMNKESAKIIAHVIAAKETSPLDDAGFC
jgi:hypothetical protein